ncbi:hypothetical protein [Bdellovibrio svalbardensis]|uniref:Tetratricopeptide repeat protein n=1 Tax=Bdellovibrio svalbardensis TaxID=2972972 RepID=A0ABT6DK88_9BACT|nr:hypothetical protein [Bdellovibrio svalbardensis]MDG0817071.1 hypothetical protein [Bdellovibrio svalbardensis]
MKEYDLNFYFDDNLQEVATNPGDMERYVHEQKIALSTAQNPLDRVKILGEIGVYLRILRQLSEAQDYLLKSLEIIARHQMELHLKVGQQIRLAHVYQWQGQFELSNSMFEELLRLSKTTDLGYLHDFIWQHAGKNHFDQLNWKKAHDCFQKALKLRELRKAPAEQIESSLQSIRATLQRMN